MQWIKINKPYRAELVKDVNLMDGENLVAPSKKEEPITGIVTHAGVKKVGKNNAKFCKFWPDACPNKCWVFGRKWINKI